MTTKEKIFSKALELFNNEGVEYVGMRELAAHLNMRVSNITYYYPTKDDLVFAISQGLKDANSKVVVASESITLAEFLNMLQQVFHNHVQYRCLLLSFVHLMEQNKVIKAQYKKTASIRNSAINSNITHLVNNGYLKFKDKSDGEYLNSALSLIIRFWISEAAISNNRMRVEKQIDHYLSITAKMILPFVTKKGKKEINMFLKMLEAKS